MRIQIGSSAHYTLARNQRQVHNAQMGALPVTLTPLVGRGQEIGAALGMLRAGQRLLTLTGPPGVGKTRLAIAIAGQAESLFSEGVQFVSLAPIGDAALAPPLVAAAFGAVGDGISGMAAVIAAQVGAGRALLVLDNFEHIPAAAPFVAELLAACPGLSVLATSRSPLRLSGEHLLPVPALSLPGAAAEDGPRSEAVDLFVARARSVCGAFDLTDRNYASVAAICRRLDGLPLAIELAAARLRVLPPQALLERLQQGLQLLAGSVQDAPARQRAMRDAIAWSYDLLGPPEQALFRRLAVFAGGWTVEAVQAVCQPDLALDPLESLSTLLDQSLIRRAERPEDEPRFEMLHVVREFALDRLAAAGEEAGAWRAHARYLRQLGQEFGSARGPEQKRLIGRVEGELNNIRAVLAWALAHASEPEDLEGALELMGSLWFFWIHHRAPREARLWLTRGLAAAPPGRSAPRAWALLALGSLEWRQADYAAARDHIEQSAEIMREIGDAGGLADTSHFAGHVLFDARDFAGAQRMYETSRAAFEQTGDVVGALPLIGDLGMVAYHQGDYATAQAWFGECLERCREHGAVTFAAESLNRLGDLARVAGDLDRAEALYTESQALEQSINSAPGLASARHKLAQVARRKGKTTEARGLLEEALAMQREMGNKQGILECLVALAGLALDWAPPERAAELLSVAGAAFASQGILLAPADLADFERDLARGQASLSPSGWTAAQERGRQLGVEEALALARGAPASVSAPPSSDAGPLSPRESEVAALIARGLSNREVAAALVITEKTAANHVEHIMTKLDLRSRAQIAVWAVRQGLAEAV